MKAISVIKKVMERKGLTNAALAEKMGLSTAAVIMKFKQKSMTTDKASEILRAMDYKLVAIPVTATDLSEAIRIEEK